MKALADVLRKGHFFVKKEFYKRFSVEKEKKEERKNSNLFWAAAADCNA